MPFAPTSVGVEVHIHHCKTGRGNDRLYIKRDYDGTVVGYCHHCGARGRHSPGTKGVFHSRLSSLSRKPTGTTVSRISPDADVGDSFPVGSGVRFVSEEVGRGTRYVSTSGKSLHYGGASCIYQPPDLCSFLQKARLTSVCELADNKDVYVKQYSSDSITFGFVIRDISSGAVVATQERVFGNNRPNANLPKYITRGSRVPYCHLPSDVDGLSDYLVISEDFLSSYRIRRVGFNSIAILGTDIKEKYLIKVLSKYQPSTVCIWLDDDNTIVRQKQSRLKRKLEAYGVENSRIIRGLGKDPKEFTDSEIAGIVYGL